MSIKYYDIKKLKRFYFEIIDFFLMLWIGEISFLPSKKLDPIRLDRYTPQLQAVDPGTD